MEWNWSWLFWQRKETKELDAGLQGRANERLPRNAQDWEERLMKEGVSEAWASRLAQELVPAHTALGPTSTTALLKGVMLTYTAHAEEQASVERNMREVREVERLLGAFTGELEKLDEVLEVLAAYAQRMRTMPKKADARRTLH